MQEVILPVVARNISVADLVAQVMGVRARTVHQLAEHALSDHVQERKLRFAIAAVFEQHDGYAGLFARAHELPAFVDRRGAAHLHRHAFAAVHREHRQLDMRLPPRHDDGRIHVGPIYARLRLGRAKGLLTALYTNQFLCPHDAVLVAVAHGRDFDVRHIEQDVKLG